MSKAEFLDKVKEAGVVGAGGAGFPTHVKLNADVEYVIVNGAECEPIIRGNQLLMEKYYQELWQALQLVVEELGASFGIIALKNKYQKAVAALEKNKPTGQHYELFMLDDFYPAGDEQVLVYEVTGRIIPEGGIPLLVGCVVLNVETLLNVLQAVDGKPVTHKIVTVSGMVKNPVTIRVPLGTPMGELLPCAGGVGKEPFEIVEGGPLMGKIVEEDDVISKTTGGIIVLPAQHPVIVSKRQNVQLSLLRARAACCQCRMCTDLCPRHLLGHGLEPHKIMRAVASRPLWEAVTTAFLCSECGVCDEFACPMGLSPRNVNKMLKQALLAQKVKNPHHNSPVQVQRLRQWHKVPGRRLISRLGLDQYDIPAPWTGEPYITSVSIPLQQHVGKAAQPLVEIGDIVKAGQLIAVIPENTAVGANIHASMGGKVTNISSRIKIVGFEGGDGYEASLGNC